MSWNLFCSRNFIISIEKEKKKSTGQYTFSIQLGNKCNIVTIVYTNGTQPISIIKIKYVFVKAELLDRYKNTLQ